MESSFRRITVDGLHRCKRIGVSWRPEGPMSIRATLRVALALLVAAVQVAGNGAAAAPTRTPDTGVYFCCCVGKCACTGDCCNHGPTEGRGESSNSRIGSRGPALEAPTSCGMWRATMQRGPDQGKVIVDDSGIRSVAPPACPRFQNFQKTPFVASDEGLRPSSPRAPPSPVIHT